MSIGRRFCKGIRVFTLVASTLMAAGCGQDDAKSKTPGQSGASGHADAKEGVLSFAGKPFADVDLAEVQFDRTTTSVNLANTQVTDAGVKELARAENLERLDLSGTNITDAAIEQLKSMPRLKYVEVHGTNVSREGHAEIVKFFASRRE